MDLGRVGGGRVKMTTTQGFLKFFLKGEGHPQMKEARQKATYYCFHQHEISNRLGHKYGVLEVRQIGCYYWQRVYFYTE